MSTGFNYVLDNILKPAGVKVGGFCEELFIDITEEEIEQWQCNVCYMVSNDARECENSHLFCAACVFAWSLTGSANCDKCPVCRVDGNHYRESKKQSEIILKRVKCQEDGCTYKGPLKFFVNHHIHGKEKYHNEDMEWVPIFSEFRYRESGPGHDASTVGMTFPPLFELAAIPSAAGPSPADTPVGPPGSIQEDMRLLSLERFAMIDRERRRRQSRFYQMRRQMMLGRVLLQHMIAEMQVDLDRHIGGQEGILTDEERGVRMQEIADLARQLEEIGLILNILMISTSPMNSTTGPVNSAGESVIIEPQPVPVSMQGMLSDDIDLFSNNGSDSDEDVSPQEDTRELVAEQNSVAGESHNSSPQTTPRSLYFFNGRSNELPRTPRLLSATSRSGFTTTAVTASTQTASTQTATRNDADANTIVHSSRLLSRPSQERNLVHIELPDSNSAQNQGASSSIAQPIPVRNPSRQAISPQRHVPIPHGPSLPVIANQQSTSGNDINPSVPEPTREQSRNQYIWADNVNSNTSLGTSYTNHRENHSINTSSNHTEHHTEHYGAQRNHHTNRSSSNSRLSNDGTLHRENALNNLSIQEPSINQSSRRDERNTTGGQPSHHTHSSRSIRPNTSTAPSMPICPPSSNGNNIRRDSHDAGMPTRTSISRVSQDSSMPTRPNNGNIRRDSHDLLNTSNLVSRPEFWSQRSSVVIEEFMPSQEPLTSNALSPNNVPSTSSTRSRTRSQSQQVTRRQSLNSSSTRSSIGSSRNTRLPMTSGQLLRSRTARGSMSKTPVKKNK